MSAYRISLAPASIGVLLWGAATALLLEEALHAGRYDVATMATPVLTAATVAAACLAHMRLAAWRPLGAAGFLLLALLGSAVMVSGTLGRLAEAKDGKAAAVQAVNCTYGDKAGELDQAKAAAQRECKTIGPRCQQWQGRIDQLTREHQHREEEVGLGGDPVLPIRGETAAGHDHMHVRMMGHRAGGASSTRRRAPGVQHRGDGDLAPRCFGSAAMVSMVSAAALNSRS